MDNGITFNDIATDIVTSLGSIPDRAKQSVSKLKINTNEGIIYDGLPLKSSSYSQEQINRICALLG